MNKDFKYQFQLQLFLSVKWYFFRNLYIIDEFPSDNALSLLEQQANSKHLVFTILHNTNYQITS